jgi:XapX domain-containing protein
MKAILISFVVGCVVGVLYGLLRVKSPAPPIIALIGLLGMVIGEPLGGWILTRSINLKHVASVCLVGERYDKQSPSTAPPAE